MVRLILALALASIAGGAAHGDDPLAANPAQPLSAQEPDPLFSAECQLARRQLELAVSAAAENRHENGSKLEPARKRTALACLGPANSTGLRAPQPVIVVPPIVTAVPPRPVTAVPPRPVVAAPPPPVKVDRLSVITSCDPSGCWDSNGTRLHRLGPNLMGPRGLCTAQGNLFTCP